MKIKIKAKYFLWRILKESRSLDIHTLKRIDILQIMKGCAIVVGFCLLPFAIIALVNLERLAML
jgi:hypothetical protein